MCCSRSASLWNCAGSDQTSTCSQRAKRRFYCAIEIRRDHDGDAARLRQRRDAKMDVVRRLAVQALQYGEIEPRSRRTMTSAWYSGGNRLASCLVVIASGSARARSGPTSSAIRSRKAATTERFIAHHDGRQVGGIDETPARQRRSGAVGSEPLCCALTT